MVMEVPTLQLHGPCLRTLLFSISISVPSSSPSLLLRNNTCATAATEANASPRKPMVLIF